ncbi:Uncharacterized protein Adt_40292 [Abeliophyllum distichum]|uniref:Uncharacterized protein n=1 Tax=Abeliophyllum distichum TaxID=126358 RepID=A0ABD1Q7L9_9LAMI
MVEKEESKSRVYKAKGFIYIDVKINGKPIKTMVDTGATHNYFVSPEVERIVLVLKKGSRKVKVINSVAQPIIGVANKGFKRNELSFLYTLRLEEIEKATGPIPKLVRRHLHEFEDVMPEEFLRILSPMRAIDHEIELILGAKPNAKVPYRMDQPELEELRKQLVEMLDSGIIVPVKFTIWSSSAISEKV